jgi:hypothetical protein
VDLSDDTRIVPSRQVTARKVEDRAVLVDLETGRCWELNRVGFAIWQLLASGESVARTASAVSARYGVSGDVTRGDVLVLLRSLLEAGVVEIAGAR